MSLGKNISFLVVVLSALSCSSQGDVDSKEVQNEKVNGENLHAGDHYINEFGEVYILQQNDTTFQTTWINNEGFEFDTIMYLAADSTQRFARPWKEHVMLQYHWGGVVIMGDELWVNEFSSYGELQTQTQISELYMRKFFRADKEITIEGPLNFSKGHAGLKGIYFDPNPERQQYYLRVHGKIRKELFPENFKSTDESPQGLAGVEDDSYRLVFEDYTLEKPEPFMYSGYIFNNANGEPHLAWDFADSESYKLDGAENVAGPNRERVLIEGYLTQDHLEGSVLRNWTMYGQGETMTVVGTTTNLGGNGGIEPNNIMVMGFELEGHGTWPEDEVGKGITVEGKLYIEGKNFVMRDYKILN